MRSKKSGTSHQDLELSDVPIFNVETDGKGLYHIACNEVGFKIINKYLEFYASDANETDSRNVWVQ